MRALHFVSFMFSRKWVVVIIIFVLLAWSSLAYAGQGTGTTATNTGWSWNTYSGVSSWNVRITEDEHLCEGGQIYSEEMSVGFKHSGESARMTSVGHGAATGTFVSGNVLYFPARIVSDPPGKSQLSSFDLTFTPDCSLFTGGYDWSYNGPTGSCKGSTHLEGHNDAQECPVQSLVTTVPTQSPTVVQTPSDWYLVPLAQAHSDLERDQDYRFKLDWVQHWDGLNVPGGDGGGRLPVNDFEKGEVYAAMDALNQINTLEPKIEAKYKAILATDPNNYWANWDMAQLKLSQGHYEENNYYLMKALGNKNLAEATRWFLWQDYAKNYDFGLPDPEMWHDQSPIIKTLSNEGSTIQNINGQDVSKNSADPTQRSLIRWATFAPNDDVMNIKPSMITPSVITPSVINK